MAERAVSIPDRKLSCPNRDSGFVDGNLLSLVSGTAAMGIGIDKQLNTDAKVFNYYRTLSQINS